MIYSVKIQGITPYMQHRMDDVKLEEWEKNRKQIIERPEVNQDDLKRAEFHCYRNDNGKCYIPAEQLRMALVNGGTYLKSKVGTKTKSMKGIIAAVLQVSPEEILLPDYEVIDKRSAVNKNIKARVIAIRPKWMEWEAEFDMILDNGTLTKEMIIELINVTGNYVGIGSYRPTNNGYFGRFKLLDINAKQSVVV
jgi:lambda repressor-like predicted transcriptional regulator